VLAIGKQKREADLAAKRNLKGQKKEFFGLRPVHKGQQGEILHEFPGSKRPHGHFTRQARKEFPLGGRKEARISTCDLGSLLLSQNLIKAVAFLIDILCRKVFEVDKWILSQK